MRPQWLKSFHQQLRGTAPTITIEGYGPSKRIEGYYTDDAEVERQCYRQVYCYVQMGIGSYQQPVADTLKLVHRFQKDQERGPYTFNLRWFGPEDRFIKTDSFLCYPANSMDALAKGLCTHSGTEVPGTACFVPSLGAARHDLTLFFCHDRRVRIRHKQRAGYLGNRRRTCWFFLGGDQPECVLGREFEPEFVEI